MDGNGTEAQPCDPPGVVAGQLCIGDGTTPINQNYPVIDKISPNAFLGEIDRNWTATNGFGGTAQATSSAKFFDHDNHFVAGVSVDRGLTQFTGSSELGTVDQSLFVTGTGVYIDQPAADIRPVSLLATNTYTGSMRPTPSTSRPSFRSPRGRGSTSPRSTCRTRPAPTPSSTAATASTASIR